MRLVRKKGVFLETATDAQNLVKLLRGMTQETLIRVVLIQTDTSLPNETLADACNAHRMSFDRTMKYFFERAMNDGRVIK